jgi:hypothetical protein
MNPMETETIQWDVGQYTSAQRLQVNGFDCTIVPALATLGHDLEANWDGIKPRCSLQFR